MFVERSLVNVLETALTLSSPNAEIIQPYHTVAGPALSVNFDQKNIRNDLLNLPFWHPMVHQSYFTSLFDTLSEFATTARPAKLNPVKLLHAPMEHFWKDVGILNCFYVTLYHPYISNKQRRNEFSSYNSNLDDITISTGAIELINGAHRTEKDLRLSLFDAQYNILASMNITGPDSVKRYMRTELSNKEVLAKETIETKSLGQQIISSSPRNGKYEKFLQQRSSEEIDLENVCREYLENNTFIGKVEIDDQGGYKQRLLIVERERSVNDNNSNSKNDLEEQNLRLSHEHLLTCIDAFFKQILNISHEWQNICNQASSSDWILCSYQEVVSHDIEYNKIFEISCTTPLLCKNYRIPPWRHQIGLPYNADSLPCIILHVETRQNSYVTSSGTYFFAALPKTSKNDR